jgi:general secretion pathway protein A
MAGDLVWDTVEQTGERGAKLDACIVPSRRIAIEAASAALRIGPVLITGEPGSGKTWLAGKLARASAYPNQWIRVDVTPSTNPGELIRAIGRELGLNLGSDPRIDLREYLRERSEDRWRWGIVIDELQLASLEVIEEVRILSNQFGRPDGFAAMILIGQTSLIQRLRSRSLSAFETRLAARVHVQPLDADEARELLLALEPSRALAISDVEDYHRTAAGNPRRLLRLVGATVALPDLLNPKPALMPGPVPVVVPAPSYVASDRPVSRLGAGKPPLVVEDGLIEVGWDSERDGETESDESDVTSKPNSDDSTEAVEDHYAALQAWNEWARNQGRKPLDMKPAPEPQTDLAEVAGPKRTAAASSPSAEHPQVWAEGQHSFAPYSQLFARARQARDTDR